MLVLQLWSAPACGELKYCSSDHLPLLLLVLCWPYLASPNHHLCIIPHPHRCMLTGRPRAVYKEFRLSRIMFRQMALEGLLPGITKYSW